MKNFLLALLVLFAACSKDPVKVVKHTFEDGSPKVVYYYEVNDQDSVLVKETRYYQNGNKQIEGAYKDMRRDGVWTYWYENGNKWSEGYYKEGVDNGPKTVWYENGEKYYEGKMKNGERVGVWRFWDKNKDLAREINYDE